jgi:6,7-dimethyl-8-ribityllumazine synthase
MNTQISVEAHWDEPWRSVTHSHWRYLGLVLSARPVPSTPDVLEAVVTLRFWAAGVHVVSTVQVPGAGEAPRRLPFAKTDAGTAIPVQITGDRPTLLVAVLALDKVPALPTEADVPVGEVCVAPQRANESEERRRTLELTQAISFGAPVDVAVFAVGSAADLATRNVDEAQLGWINMVLARCVPPPAMSGLLSALDDIVSSARSRSSAAGDLADRAATVAADLAAGFWPSVGAEPTPNSSEDPPGEPYDFGADEFGTAGPNEYTGTRDSEAAPKSPSTASPLSILRDDEWLELERQFFAVCECAGRVAVVRARVAGIPVSAHLDLDHFPRRPPVLRTSLDLTHRLIHPEGVISRLTSLRRWNRTLGLPHVLRELEGEWGKQPPLSMSRISFWIRLRDRILSLSR